MPRAEYSRLLFPTSKKDESSVQCHRKVLVQVSRSTKEITEDGMPNGSQHPCTGSRMHAVPFDPRIPMQHVPANMFATDYLYEKEGTAVSNVSVQWVESSLRPTGLVTPV